MKLKSFHVVDESGPTRNCPHLLRRIKWKVQFGTIERAPVIASQMTPLGTSLCAGYTLAASRLLRCRNTAVARALSTSQQRWTLDTPFISDTIPLAEGVLGTVEELIAQVGQPVVGISGSLRPAERFPALHGWLDADVPPAWYCCAGAQRSYRGD